MRATEDELKAGVIAGLDGDAAAHASFLSALVPLLRAFYSRRMRDNREDIEDLVQETLIAIHTRRASYDRDRSLLAWLFSIARYKMIDNFRSRRLTCSLEGLDDILRVEGFEDSSNAQMDIGQLLGELPKKQASAIRATKIDGLSSKEAAARSGLTDSDIKISIHRGLKTLAARIARTGR